MSGRCSAYTPPLREAVQRGDVRYVWMCGQALSAWIEYIPRPESCIFEHDGDIWYRAWDDGDGWILTQLTKGPHARRP